MVSSLCRQVVYLAKFAFNTHSHHYGRSSGLMVSTLDSGLSGPGSSPGQGHCFVPGQDTFLSQCLSAPRCINGSQ